jgi:glutathione synthase/RimK-type ligase-like ATP-grasp enzyme
MWCRLRLLASQGVARYVAPHRCFGLLGVDLMVDASGRPWLLEVNNCPNISGATGHVARDARAAAWRGDVFENAASKNYEVKAANALKPKFRCNFCGR